MANSMQKTRSVSVITKFRKWNKVVEPIVKYNRISSSLGYPLDFFYELEQIISAGHSLTLNIATTLTGTKDNCIRTVFESNQEVGRVIFIAAILKSSFDNEIQREMQERITKFCERDVQFESFYNSIKENNACDQILPCALIKEKTIENNGIDHRVITMNRDQYKKILNLQANQIAQCFVWGCGKQTSVIRFFYFPNKQNSEAYKIDNLQGFMKRRYGKGQFKVRQQTQNSLAFVKIMYTNKSFYNQTITLKEFLERHLKIDIEKMVTDWILDPNNRYFLIDLKELRYSKRPQLVRAPHSLVDTLAYLTCAVCQQKFRAEEVTKNLTDKLIFQFFEHLQKRQISLSFTPSKRKSCNTARLCDLCYMLVVSESELIELQKSVAFATHSLSLDPQLLSRWDISSEYSHMYEWRLFLYLQDVRDLNISNYDPSSEYYIMVMLHNSITSFKLSQPANQYNLVKGIKIHYLFSEAAKIEKFLINSEITVRITRGNSWNSVIAQGSTSGLYEQSEKHSMRKFKQILVFDANSKYSVVGMHIGIRLEGRYDPKGLSMNRYHDVFMVDSYSNCYSLPAEWMQTIDPSYCITKAQNPTFNYGLHLNSVERKALLPAVSTKHRKLIL